MVAQAFRKQIFGFNLVDNSEILSERFYHKPGFLVFA